GRTRFGRGGEWGTQEDDPEIRVGRDRRLGRFDRAKNTLPDACARLRQRRCGDFRAADEFRRAQVPAGSKNMDVAGFRRLQLIETCGLECGRDCFCRRHPAGPCSALTSKAATRSLASIDAMLACVTFCSPDHAGMLLTSSTVGRLSAPYRMS